MPWSTGLESQRGNLTSMLGTLAQMREGKKNRRSALLRDLLGIGAQFGGAALQNKWSKQAADTANQRAIEQSNREFEQQRQAQLEQRGYETRSGTAQAMANTRELAAKLRGEKDIEQMRINAGAYSRGGREQEDASKLIPYDIASQAWDGWWERLQTANPKRQMSANDFDDFRTVAVQAGAKYGFSQQQMEEAVNVLAQSYGFSVTPNVPAATPASIPPVSARVPAQGFGEHYQATKKGIAAAGGMISKEAGKAWAGIKESVGIKPTTMNDVLAALQRAKLSLTPRDYAKSLGQYEAQLQAGIVAPEALNKIMRIIQTVLGK